MLLGKFKYDFKKLMLIILFLIFFWFCDVCYNYLFFKINDQCKYRIYVCLINNLCENIFFMNNYKKEDIYYLDCKEYCLY